MKTPKTVSRLLSRAFLGMAAVLLLAPASAQVNDYPNRPIRFVVPFSAGGPTDNQARALAKKLGEALNQSVYVDNRPGGASNIGTDIVAKAKPDGYTLLFTSVTFVINPSLFDKLPFDPLKDFAPITLFSSSPSVLAVHPDLPARNLQELIALIKANPGKYSFASGGNGSTQHLAGERLKLVTGVQATHVPYKGEAPAMADVIGGHVPIIFSSVTSSLAHIQSGKIRPIAVTSAKRNPALPDVPTVAESGLPDFDVVAWFGILAPAGTPPEIVKKLNQEMVKIIRSPELSEKIISQGGMPGPNSPEEFAAYLKAEVPRWAKLIKDSGASLD